MISLTPPPPYTTSPLQMNSSLHQSSLNDPPPPQPLSLLGAGDQASLYHNLMRFSSSAIAEDNYPTAATSNTYLPYFLLPNGVIVSDNSNAKAGLVESMHPPPLPTLHNHNHDVHAFPLKVVLTHPSTHDVVCKDEHNREQTPGTTTTPADPSTEQQCLYTSTTHQHPHSMSSGLGRLPLVTTMGSDAPPLSSGWCETDPADARLLGCITNGIVSARSRETGDSHVPRLLSCITSDAVPAAAQPRGLNDSNPVIVSIPGTGPFNSSKPSGNLKCSGSRTGPTPASRYESQKRRDWNTFGQYLKNHRPPLALPRCSGAHVLEFLRYLDHFGKTKVHGQGCPFYGLPQPPGPCACPLRQAWGSLDALIGRLRAAFEENGGKADSNPFGARAVRLYLREVRDMQAKARGIAYQKKKKRKSTRSGPPAAARQDEEAENSAISNARKPMSSNVPNDQVKPNFIARSPDCTNYISTSGSYNRTCAVPTSCHDAMINPDDPFSHNHNRNRHPRPTMVATSTSSLLIPNFHAPCPSD